MFANLKIILSSGIVSETKIEVEIETDGDTKSYFHQSSLPALIANINCFNIIL